MARAKARAMRLVFDRGTIVILGTDITEKVTADLPGRCGIRASRRRAAQLVFIMRSSTISVDGASDSRTRWANIRPRG